MLLLSLDTATPAVTVALSRHEPAGVTVLAERVTVDARRHAELLAPAVADVLARCGARPADLAAVAVGLGPGPFTGLRVGIVTAACLADALGIPAYGACSLDVLAAACRPGHPDVVVATDARRREVYAAVYRAGVRVTGPAVLTPAALAARIVDEGLPRAVAGEGPGRYPDVLGAPGGLDVLDVAFPRAADLARLVHDRVLSGDGADPLAPLYLRRPDAAPPGPRRAVVPA